MKIKKGGSFMANNFRTIYLYIVSLITLCMIIGGIVSTVNNIVSYFYPDSYIFFEDDTTTSIYDTPTSITYNNAKNAEIKQNNYKKEKKKNTVVSVAVIIVGAIMYRYHSRRANRNTFSVPNNPSSV